MNRRIFTRLALLLAGAVSLPVLAQSEWPSRPIRLVVPSAAGGASDTFARLIAVDLGAALKTSVVVDNKPGANGRIGTQILLNSPPDGYTILLSFGSAVVAVPALYPGEPNDARKLQPVARFGAQGAMIVVTPDVPVQNLRQLIDYAKASKTPISYATYGVGSGAHVMMEAFSRSAGIKMEHIPYKESTRVVADMQGGTLKLAAIDVVSPIPFIQQGKLRALAVSGHQRLPATSQIPTMEEQGFPIFLETFYGIFVPMGTPRPIVERLNAEVNAIVSSPAMLERFTQLNLARTPTVTPEQFATYIKEEFANWEKVVRENAIKPE